MCFENTYPGVFDWGTYFRVTEIPKGALFCLAGFCSTRKLYFAGDGTSAIFSFGIRSESLAKNPIPLRLLGYVKKSVFNCIKTSVVFCFNVFIISF